MKETVLGGGDKILNLHLKRLKKRLICISALKISLALGSYREQVEKKNWIYLSNPVLDLLEGLSDFANFQWKKPTSLFWETLLNNIRFWIGILILKIGSSLFLAYFRTVFITCFLLWQLSSEKQLLKISSTFYIHVLQFNLSIAQNLTLIKTSESNSDLKMILYLNYTDLSWKKYP